MLPFHLVIFLNEFFYGVYSRINKIQNFELAKIIYDKSWKLQENALDFWKGWCYTKQVTNTSLAQLVEQ